ncbi:hypothetical protein CU098_000603, partial [Rhizopus stolonifer]
SDLDFFDIDNLLEQVELSKSDIPKGFKMPESLKDFMPTAPAELEEDENFWYESGDESDFGVDDYEEDDDE